MKTILTLLLVFVFCISVPFLIQNVSAENAFSDNYNKSQIVLVGKVLSLEQTHNATICEVQVEKYYKNPQSAKSLAVFGPAKGVYLLYDPTFDVGDRLFLYLKQRDGIYEIQDSSFKLEYDCDAGELVPPPTQTYPSNSAMPWKYPKLSDADFVGDIHKVGKKMQIKYEVYNYAPVIKHAAVTLSVIGTNQNKTVFSDQKTVTVSACNGSVPLTWNFTPQRADEYVAQVKVTAGYDTQRYGVFVDELPVSSIFKARENVAGGSTDRMVYPIIESPLKQIKTGTQPHNVVCDSGLELAQKKDDEQSACITIFTKIELIVRGWAHDDRVLLGCTGERVHECYPDDPKKYRDKLYDYYLGKDNLPSSGDYDFTALHTVNACTDKPWICYGELDNGTKIRISCDYPVHGCGVRSFDNYTENRK